MKRLSLISWGFIAFAVILLFRLFFLQVISHDVLSAKGDAQRLYSVTLEEPERGAIMDRNGSSVTADKKTYSLLVVPFLVDDPVLFSQKVGDTFDVSKDKLESKIIGINTEGKEIRKQPFILKGDLTFEEMDRANKLGEDGLFVVPYQNRYYRDFLAQHLVGSLKWNGDTWVGISGLERIYDDVLSEGIDDKMSILIDEKNRVITSDNYFNDDNKTMAMVKTTIDPGIQKVSESALEGHSGAVVVLDSTNCDVLALVSSPEYDPYFMTELKSEDVYMNKALSSYPPASMFKIFIAAVALEEGIVAPESTFFCDGSYSIDYGNDVSCWNEDGHGFITFEDSLACSCNPVYVKTALDLGPSRIKEAFALWELNQDELLGYPLDDLSNISFSDSSNAAVSNIGLGENGVCMTPLTVAKMINVVASGGMMYTPRVVTEVYDNKGMLSDSIEISDPKRVLSEENAGILVSMMAKTFQNGTAASLHLGSFHIAGKTGSSETGSVWIGGFFPYDDPQYTVVVLVTDGESGVADAGPIMKKICAYLGNLS